MPVSGPNGPAAARSASDEAAPVPAGHDGAAAQQPASAGRLLQGAWRVARALAERVPGAPDTIAETSLIPEAGRVYHPSPEDWRDESFYFAFLDRFARSGPGRPVGRPNEAGSRHGGNIRGVIEKLDYLKGVGATTLMISPVTQTLPDSYHGYAPVHMMAVDPHLGTMDDLKELVREAHKRGIRIVLDLVINHAGPVFEYENGSGWVDMDKPAKPIGEWTHPLLPRELGQDENFTRHGVIEKWNDEVQSTEGDFPPNYRKYNAANQATADRLIHIANWWIKETDVDGFRLDAVKHFSPGFLPVFQERVSRYAAGLGKKNFFFVGESSTGHDKELKPLLEEGKLQSVFNYPSFRRDYKALHGAAPTIALERSHKTSVHALGGALGRLLRFIDGHDVYRFLRVGQSVDALHAALGYALLSVGIPIVYYGTEQAFRQGTSRLEPEGPDFPADLFNREDMFADGQFKSDSSRGDKFDAGSPTYKYVAALNALRARYPALRRGEQFVRWSDPHGAGLYAFSRIDEGQEVVVVMNTSAQERRADMWVDKGLTAAGTELADALDPEYRITAYADEAGAKIDVEVPPHGVRVFVRAAELPESPVLAPASPVRRGPPARKVVPAAPQPEVPGSVEAPVPPPARAPIPGPRLNIMIAAAEAVPFIKTGGLADVVDAVARGMAERGHEVTLAMPLYKQTKTEGLHLQPAGEVSVPMGDKTVTAKLWTARREGVNLLLIDNPELFYDEKGPYHGGSVYGVDANEKRFAFYSRAVLEAAKKLDLKPDVIHSHDWHAALIPAYLKEVYKDDPYFARTATALTIHNIAFQGHYPKKSVTGLGFPKSAAERGGSLAHGRGINYLKAALVTVDAITTVSRTYAREIVESVYFGMGLDKILRRRRDVLSGIVNGVDPALFDPRTDPEIFRRYGLEDMAEGKAANKADLQRRLGLLQDPEAPVFSIASRLSDQKGIDIALSAAHQIVARGGQLVITGSGDKALEKKVAELVQFYGYEGRVAFHHFDESFVHQVYAGSDFLLMPSRFEPCGLSQLIAQRYGTIPIVAPIGGLVDTVVDLRADPLRGDGLFIRPDQDGGIWETVNDAVAGYRDPLALSTARRSAMTKDSSWGPALDEYETLFQKIVAARRDGGAPR